MLNIFSCTCLPSVYLWGKKKMSILVLCSFLIKLFGGFCFVFVVFICLFLLLSSLSFAFILDLNSLSDILFANIFYHLVGCPFICWWFSLLCRSFLVWYSPICLFLFQLPLLFRVRSKNSITEIMSRNFWERVSSYIKK